MTDYRVQIIDTETTGLDLARDQIIELCIQFGADDGSEQKVWRIRPSPGLLTAEAEAIHGITMEDLSDEPMFPEVADEIRGCLEKAETIIGYNVDYDLGMIRSEYVRLLQQPPKITEQIIDPLLLWRKFESKDLQTAHKRFVGHTFSGAHGAASDVAATGRVLKSMVEHFGHDMCYEDLLILQDPTRPNWVAETSHFQWVEGRATLSFGKHAGTPIVDLVAENPGYAHWILKNVFPDSVNAIVEKALAGEWVDRNS